jgi:hypothetical protein
MDGQSGHRSLPPEETKRFHPTAYSCRMDWKELAQPIASITQVTSITPRIVADALEKELVGLLLSGANRALPFE